MSCLQLSITFFILHRLTPNDPKSFQNDIGQCTVSSFFFLYSCYRDHYIQISYLNILCFLVSLLFALINVVLTQTKPLFLALYVFSAFLETRPCLICSIIFLGYLAVLCFNCRDECILLPLCNC